MKINNIKIIFFILLVVFLITVCYNRNRNKRIEHFSIDETASEKDLSKIFSKTQVKVLIDDKYIKDTENEDVYQLIKQITNSQNYKSSNMYSDTISNEKKIIENISSLMAEQIINEMSLSLRNDI